MCVLQVTSQVAWDDQKWASLGATDNFAAILTGVLPVYVAGMYDFWTNSGTCRFMLLLLFIISFRCISYTGQCVHAYACKYVM